MRLAREYERAEGRDLRGFLAYAAGQDLAEAREGEAPLESEGLDAVRLMTIHRAKGLEFPVVCVADLGRPGVGRARAAADRPRRRASGLRLATLAGGDPVPALGYADIAERLTAAEAAEERRLFYVADDPRRGAAHPVGRDRCREVARAAPGRTRARLARAGAARRSGRRARRRARRRSPAAATARVAVRLVTPATLAPEAAAPSPPGARRGARHRAPGGAQGRAGAAPAAPRPAPPVLLGAPRLRPLPVPLLPRADARPAARAAPPTRREPPARPIRRGRPAASRRGAARGPGARHDRPRPARAARLRPARRARRRRRCTRWPPRSACELHDAHVADVQRLVAAFAGSPLCARLAAARHVRREAAFAFALDPDGGGPLVRGFVDVAGRRAGRDAADRRLQDGSARRARARRAGGARLRDPARRLRARRAPAGRRGARRGRLLPARAPAGAGGGRLHAGRHPRAPGRRARARGRAAGRALARRRRAPPRPVRRLPRPRALCSWPEALTLRPAYEASAGSLAGSGGPS